MAVEASIQAAPSAFRRRLVRLFLVGLVVLAGFFCVPVASAADPLVLKQHWGFVLVAPEVTDLSSYYGPAQLSWDLTGQTPGAAYFVQSRINGVIVGYTNVGALAAGSRGSLTLNLPAGAKDFYISKTGTGTLTLAYSVVALPINGDDELEALWTLTGVLAALIVAGAFYRVVFR